MKKKSEVLYDEFKIKTADTEFVFFIDKGFGCSGQYHSDDHFHKFNEMVYCFKGDMEIIHEENTSKISSGDVALIAGNTAHSLTALENTYCMMLSFWKNSSDYGEQVKIFKKFPAAGAFERMMAYYHGNYTYKEEFISSCLHEIAATLMELSCLKDAAQKSAPTLENHNFREYIIENYFNAEYKNSPTIAELAEILHLSIQQTRRIIFKMYNQTFRERITCIRIEKAKTLLKIKENSIDFVSAEVGYKSTNNFYLAFKNYTGLTPQNYRNK